MKDLRAIALALLAAAAVTAQDGPPTFVVKPGAMFGIAVEDIPALLAQLPKTAAGRLLAEPDVQSAFAAGLARYRAMAERRSVLFAAARERDLPGALAIGQELWQHLDPVHLERCELLALPGSGDQPVLRTVAVVQVLPRAEGRLTRAFDDCAAALARSKHLRAVANAKLGGLPAHVFEPVLGNDEQSDPFRPSGYWLAHLPGVFAGGEGTPEQCGVAAAAPARGAAGASLTVEFEPFFTMLAKSGLEDIVRAILNRIGLGGVVRQNAVALGLDKIERLQWHMTFAGERILDEIELEISAPPGSFVAALLDGKAGLPRQPLPAGALLQLRASLNFALLLEAAAASRGGLAWTEVVQKEVTAAFDGGVALGVAAPDTGGVMPRLLLSAGIADAAALDLLLQRLPAAGIESKLVTYEGVACTVLTLPGLPTGLRPTFCRTDGVLHVAESELSMRVFLQARAAGGDAMDVGDAPQPDGPGVVVPGFDLRCDEAALYRAFYTHWLPLYERASASRLIGEPLLRRDEMPSPDVVDKHVGRSRGLLRRRDGKCLVQHLGTLGGPVAAALAMAWGPILTGPFHRDYRAERLINIIASTQLDAVWPALENYHRAQGHWPATLGNLYVAGKLADEALLIPGDALAEDVPMPAGVERKVKSSYRYFPKGVGVNGNGNGGTMLLIQVAGMPFRAMLGTDGSRLDIWGEESRMPIDQFGK